MRHAFGGRIGAEFASRRALLHIDANRAEDTWESVSRVPA